MCMKMKTNWFNFLLNNPWFKSSRMRWHKLRHLKAVNGYVMHGCNFHLERVQFALIKRGYIVFFWWGI